MKKSRVLLLMFAGLTPAIGAKGIEVQDPASLGTQELEARVKERGRALVVSLESDSTRPEELREPAGKLADDATGELLGLREHRATSA